MTQRREFFREVGVASELQEVISKYGKNWKCRLFKIFDGQMKGKD